MPVKIKIEWECHRCGKTKTESKRYTNLDMGRIQNLGYNFGYLPDDWGQGMSDGEFSDKVLCRQCTKFEHKKFNEDYFKEHGEHPVYMA